MSAAEPVKPPVVQIEPDHPGERRGSAKLGVIAFTLAILVFLFEPAVNALVNTPRFIDQASTISGGLIGIQIFATLGVLALAIVAALGRRGAGWAFAAMAIVIAGNGLVRTGIHAVFDLLFRAIFGTP